MYSRYLRQRGRDVLHICATDEHGTPAEPAAEEQGLPVDTFCAQAHDAQKTVYDGFALAFDYFGRSSSPQNVEITQHFARRLKENGFIEERAIRQVYCTSVPAGTPFTVPPVLFAKLTDDDLEAYKERFGGEPA